MLLRKTAIKSLHTESMGYVRNIYKACKNNPD